jgi:hypothetical protein
MSGSSGYSGPPASLPADNADCARYVKETVLSSPKPAIIAGLRSGDELTVEFDSPPNDRVIVATTTADGIAGSITGEGRLRDCMIKGYRYVAIVQSVSGGACRVQIRSKA